MKDTVDHTESYPQFAEQQSPQSEEEEEKKYSQNFGSFAGHNNQRADFDLEEEQPVELFEVNLLNATAGQENPFGQASPKQTDGINADEFEHIAEIYDQIRMLHQTLLFSERSNPNLKTQVDRNLASYFDSKLK